MSRRHPRRGSTMSRRASSTSKPRSRDCRMLSIARTSFTTARSPICAHAPRPDRPRDGRGCGASARDRRSRARAAHRRGALPPPALRPIQSEGVRSPSDVRDTYAGTATRMPWRRDTACGCEASPSGPLGEGRFHVSHASCADCGLRFSRAFAAVSQRRPICRGPLRLDATAVEVVGQQLYFESPPGPFVIRWPEDRR
jgi:hypothetical protein